MENNRHKLMDDLNLVLKDNFDDVSVLKVRNVADKLIKKGWRFNVIIIDKECLDCKRYYSGSCSGVEDRKREKITIENSCAGHLKRD